MIAFLAVCTSRRAAVESGITMRYLARVSQMSPTDRWTLLAAVAWMPVFSLGLHALGLARFHSWLKCTRLRIGVRLDDAAFDAHAWVEVEGVPVNDKPDIARHFAAFDDLPAATLFRAR